MTDFVTIATLILSGYTTASQLIRDHKECATWEQRDKPVNRDWLPLAIEKGDIPGPLEGYVFMSERRLATAELSGTHEVIFLIDPKMKTKSRIVHGGILVKRLVSR